MLNKVSVRVAVLTALLCSPFFVTQALAHDENHIPQLVEEVSAAVVNISTTQKVERKQAASPFGKQRSAPGNGNGSDAIPFDDFFRRFFEGQPGNGSKNNPSDKSPKQFEEATSLGSGFIISKDGYILTNHHVIDGADEIIVRLHDQRELEAEIIGSDERSDVALIKISAADLPTVKIGSSKTTRVGEDVIAIGSPFGFKATVTAGIVSAKGRVLGRQQYLPLIQTDVAINPGNSGGPLFNFKGEVIGINSMIYSRSGGYMGLSFAIPMDLAMTVTEQLKTNGKVARGWLGVMLQEVDRELAESFGLDKPRGAAVRGVLPDSPAKKAGLEVGDIILKYNNIDVADVAALPPLVGRTQPGDAVPAVVQRNGEQVTLTIVIGELPEQAAAEGAVKQKSVEVLGLAVRDITDEERSKLKLESTGILVVRVSEGPAAAEVKPGDVILKFNYKNIESTQQFETLVGELETGQAVPVLVKRDGTPMFLAIRMQDSDDE